MTAHVGRILTPDEVFARLPQQEPFRFLDEIVHVDGDSIVARYRWREDSEFYRGHFPGNPITPGVLLVESMAHTLEPHHLPHYAQELATTFHDFYEQCRVVDAEQPELSKARLKLVAAARSVLAITLGLMGMDAPDRM